MIHPSLLEVLRAKQIHRDYFQSHPVFAAWVDLIPPAIGGEPLPHRPSAFDLLRHLTPFIRLRGMFQFSTGTIAFPLLQRRLAAGA